MARRRRRDLLKLEFKVEDKFASYGSWDYIISRPAFDPSLYKLLVEHYGKDFATAKKLTDRSATRYLFPYVKYHTDEFKELSIQFEDYARDNAWIKEYYDFCLERASHVRNPYDPECNWIFIHANNNFNEDQEKMRQKVENYLSSGMDFKRFDILCNGNPTLLSVFNEIKRPVPFVVGNIVRLRTAQIGSRNHDPFYREPKEIRDQERVGYITAILDKTHSRSYNGKGSRLVKVFWQATGKENQQSVSSLKLFDQKNNKMVDKLVDE